MSGCFTLILLAALSGGESDVTLVQFTDPRCQPCRAMEPVIQRLASESYPLKRVDVTQQPQLARQYNIVAYPTFVLFQGGREVQRFAGMTTYDDLVQMIARGQMPRSVDPRAVASSPTPPLVRGQSPETALSGQANPNSRTIAAASANPEQRALAATVRLKVEDAEGWGVGTGTIIDTHLDEASQQYEALVLTCGHLFKSTQGQGKIEVELFPGGGSPVAGELLDYDEHLDVALVSIWPGMQVAPVPVAAAGHVVRPQDAVFTVGCSNGQDPTLERSKIHAVNRYANRPNFTIGGRQAQGRSGGGLFNAAGELIGVCNCDDPQDSEGIFAGLAAVHGQLDKFNLQALYQRQATAPVAHVEPAAEPLADASPAAELELGAETPTVATADLPRRSPPPAAAIPASGVERKELVCIFRDRENPAAQSEVLVIDAASAELIQRILAEAKATGQARVAARQSEQAGLARRVSPGSPPIVRGQGE